jgi:hypothetical protein
MLHTPFYGWRGGGEIYQAK